MIQKLKWSEQVGKLKFGLLVQKQTGAEGRNVIPKIATFSPGLAGCLLLSAGLDLDGAAVRRHVR